jgi:cytochrome c oxidase cbb3-type subunit 3
MKRLGLIILILSAGCHRESRKFTESELTSTRTDTVRLTSLQPASTSPAPVGENPYRDNAYALSEGKRLFTQFNCVGCHSMGGGGIGPALMDDRWIYGYQPEQIFSTIVQGRPDGMPSFGGRIPEQQVWQLVAYVRSLSGGSPRDAATSRNDDLTTGKPENRLERLKAVQTGHR